MRKFVVTTVLILLLVAPLIMVSPILAATTDFTADANITVSSVTYRGGGGTVDMLILDGSTTESWGYASNTFTVTNAGAFKVGSAIAAVTAIVVRYGSAVAACALNTTAGTSYVTVPTGDRTYTVEPSSTISSCTSEFCSTVEHAATYNAVPTCGAATCDTGFTLSGSGASATCIASSSGGGSVGSPSSTAPAPAADETPEAEEPEPIAETPEETPPVAETPTVSETPGVAATDEAGDVTLEQMTADATTVVSGDVNQVIAKMGVERDTATETTYDADIVTRVVADTEITAAARSTIVNFVTYGTPATKVLGAGERGGVVNSFKAAFGKLPATTEEWNDVVKIANGRWPSVTSETAEARSKITFKTIYLREADMNDAHDNAAVTVMAYGLRPAKRNLDSERAAIRTFKAIYKYIPESATNWDAVRAIAYSGATR